MGHSDADVVCHAVADALLGAAGLGDIGEHYPDTDPQWSGLDSTRLLAEVVDQVRRAGWRPVNCDVIIHAQEPKLGPSQADDQGQPGPPARLRRVRGERQGQDRRARRPVGRGEAIACQAVVLLDANPESLNA